MSKFTVGTQVWVSLGRNLGDGYKRTVVKVYKNGNFIIEGDKRQYRVFGDTAHRAGASDVWVSATIYVYDDIKDRVEAAVGIRKLQTGVRAAEDALRKLDVRKLGDDARGKIPALIKLVQEITGVEP